MLAIFVTIDVKAGTAEAFAEASLGDAQGACRDEPGCYRFDMHRDPENENRFYLYEVYKDQDAFAAHQKAPHYLAWREAVGDMFDGSPSAVMMTPTFPSEQGWQRQKASLTEW